MAEDDEILSRLIARFLESQSGVTTLLARDGAEALEILEQRRDDVDLLVTDIVMPSPGGFELAALAVEWCPEIRVLYISGRYEDNVHVRWGLKQSGRFFLKKQSRSDHSRAVTYFEQAVEIDPQYAPAWAGLADGYT